jgi:aspartate aminotransferase
VRATGAIVVVGPDAASTAATVSQLKILVRANWSNPPAHGARIVAITLADPGLRSQWFDALKTMSGRIQSMRQKLKDELVALGTPGTWDHITQQIGMFSFTGLTGKHVTHLLARLRVCGRWGGGARASVLYRQPRQY